MLGLFTACSLGRLPSTFAATLAPPGVLPGLWSAWPPVKLSSAFGLVSSLSSAFPQSLIQSHMDSNRGRVIPTTISTFFTTRNIVRCTTIPALWGSTELKCDLHTVRTANRLTVVTLDRRLSITSIRHPRPHKVPNSYVYTHFYY